jgi:hypothetical protein
VSGGRGQQLAYVVGVRGRRQSDRQEGLCGPERSRVENLLLFDLQGAMIAIQKFDLLVPSNITLGLISIRN